MSFTIQADNAQPNAQSIALDYLLPATNITCLHSLNSDLSLYLQMLDQHTPPYSGSVHYSKEVTTAYIDNKIRLISWLPSINNLTLAVEYHQLETQQQAIQRADNLLDYFACSSIKSKFPADLTPLETKTLLIARVLMLQPDVIFFDAPFCGLSHAEQKNLSSKLIDLSTHFKVRLICNEPGLEFMQQSNSPIIYCADSHFFFYHNWNAFKQQQNDG